MKKILAILLLLMLTGCGPKTIRHTLFFYGLEDNSIIYTKEVEEGKYYIEEKGEEIDGYEFEGWKVDGELVSEIDVTSDMNIYASYRKIYEDYEYVIYVDNYEQTVEVGETKKLEFFTEPEGYKGEIRVYSSVDGILEIMNDGVVKGLKEGSTVVTVELMNSAIDFMVYVLKPGETIADYNKSQQKYFNLKSDEILHLGVGDSYQIKYDTNVKIENIINNDKDIISLDSNNLITAKKLGFTTIEIYDKNYNYGASIIVYVEGHELSIGCKTPDRIARVGEWMNVWADYATFEENRVSTVNGFGEKNVKVVVENGPDIFAVDGADLRMIEPYDGDLNIHIEIGKTVSNTITVHCTSED